MPQRQEIAGKGEETGEAEMKVGEAEEEEVGAEEGEEEEEEILGATDGLREETGYQPLRLLQAHLTYPTSHHN